MMRGTLNAHKVFKGTDTYPGYLKALNLHPDQEQLLRDARDKIRQALQQGMPQWDSVAKAQTLVEHRNLALASQLPTLRPRFRMQGSCVYRTINDPAHKPPQEVDYDDGVFLPTSFINEASDSRPLLAARGYFKVVESILGPLCVQNGWTLVTNKPTCIRVGIDDEAHIDLPLYAIPDEEFTTLNEASVHAMKSGGQAPQGDRLELAETVYEKLTENRIMLARRDLGWIESDPRKIEDWFIAAIKEHGEVIRRVCRYIKGWRDHQWRNGGPSSIILMACVVTVFDDLNGTLPENRDDLALQAIVLRLDGLFKYSIPNPVLPEKSLNDHWSEAERLDFITKAVALETTINDVLNNTFHKHIALTQLQEKFGNRVPSDELLLDLDTKEREIRSYPAARVAAPTVPRTTSG